MLGFSFIQYTNTWLSHKAFFITGDIDITTSTEDRLRNVMGSRNKEQVVGQCVRSSEEGGGGASSLLTTPRSVWKLLSASGSTL